MRFTHILLVITMIITLMLSACGTKKTEIKNKITGMNEFGDPVIDITVEDFLSSGFEIGDSVDVRFSNGNIHEDIPLFDNYYGKRGDVILLAFYENMIMTSFSMSYTDSYPTQIGDEVTITLNEKGKYLEFEQLYYLRNSKVRYEDQTDEEFGNSRMLTAGNINKRRIYRSGSPVDPKYKRTEVISKYIEDNDIKTVINLANSEEDVAGFDNKTEIIKKMVENGDVLCENMTADFTTDLCKGQCADIIRDIMSKEAPFLIHCSLGQDRTGFICALVEAMCGAAYDEIVDDYMLTYSNLYDFTKESNLKKYNLMKERIDDIIREITGAENPSELSVIDIREKTENYLKEIGLSNEDIIKARAVLCD